MKNVGNAPISIFMVNVILNVKRGCIVAISVRNYVQNNALHAKLNAKLNVFILNAKRCVVYLAIDV